MNALRGGPRNSGILVHDEVRECVRACRYGKHWQPGVAARRAVECLNPFTGWVDVGLTDQGPGRSDRSGGLIADTTCCPTCSTPRCCGARSPPRIWRLDSADGSWIPVRRSWRLNRYHYGALRLVRPRPAMAEAVHGLAAQHDTPPPPIGSRAVGSARTPTLVTPTSAVALSPNVWLTWSRFCHISPTSSLATCGSARRF